MSPDIPMECFGCNKDDRAALLCPIITSVPNESLKLVHCDGVADRIGNLTSGSVLGPVRHSKSRRGGGGGVVQAGNGTRGTRGGYKRGE